MHVVRQEERHLDSHTLTVDVPGAPPVASAPAAQALRSDAGAWVAVVGTPVFLIKKGRMPHCAFCVDAHGIERRSRAGTLARSWADIREVRRYRRGYLVIYDRGAMPIPFRCMDREQEGVFRRLASRSG